MLKKDSEIKQVVEARKYFNDIKKAITEAPILVSPYFLRDFMIKHIFVLHSLQLRIG